MSGGQHASHGDSEVISLKLLVDKVRNRVIFAESDHEFIDTLLSFLTLPLGAVLQLIGSDMSAIGSVGNLYASVSALDVRHFRTVFCKAMLLSPRNASGAQCSKLKVDLNPPLESEKFYFCSSHLYSETPPLSTLKGVRCQCGSPMFREMSIEEEDDSRFVDGSGGDGVFTKGGAASFMITDDLQILPVSTASCISLLRKLGITDGNDVEERTVQIRIAEVLLLLKFSLLSKSPLTEAILLNQLSSVKDTVMFEHKKAAQSDKKAVVANSNSTSLKILVCKSKKRVLYAEAGVDVVDFLFSFLTFPLGIIVKLLGRNSRLGCMDNLYKGAEELSNGNYIKSEECTNMLVCPKLAPYLGFENHPLLIEEYPQYVFNRSRKLKLLTDANVKSRGSFAESSEETGLLAVMMDPKSPTGSITTGKGYLKGPAIFMITDTLKVMPLSPIASITLLNNLKVSVNDVEERVVTMGKDEALNLLKASLVSKTALTDVFNWREPYPDVMLKV